MRKELACESEYIARVARAYSVKHPKNKIDVSHIDNIPGSRIYVRNAEQITNFVSAPRNVLDWGCGYGQMSWLLANRGYTVQACDWQRERRIPDLLDNRIQYTPLESPTKIPVPDHSQDVVVSSGTLEHVGNIHESIMEIRRILKPSGWFLVFRFPNIYSISEYVARKSNKWSHAIRMNKSQLRFLLTIYSFRVDKIGYDSCLPIFFGRRLQVLRPFREKYDDQITIVDKAMTKIPLISMLSTSIYCFAQVNSEMGNS